ncbi:MAG: FAD-dependent thymidylate synthase [Pseudomonadota bacterium]|nr:FAD-dependent thymidylate synthase [Pseudomonadota bacterium]
MTLPLDRLVFSPEAAVIGRTIMDFSALDQAIMMSQAEDAAATDGTPLNKLSARVMNDGGNLDDLAEYGGRQCYRSWSKGRDPEQYVANIIEQGHGSIFEHAVMNFQITGVSRSLTHELIRHRAGNAFSQESQRYVDAKDMRFVVPALLAHHLKETTDMSEAALETDAALTMFREKCAADIASYVEHQALYKRIAGEYPGLVSAKKRANEAAREVLPNAAETRLLFTANLRSFRHIASSRGAEFADLQIRRLACLMLDVAREHSPIFFAAVKRDIGTDGMAIITAENGKV